MNGNSTKLTEIMNADFKIVDIETKVKEAAHLMIDNALNMIVVEDHLYEFRILQLSDVTPEVLKGDKRISDLYLNRVPVYTDDHSVKEAYTDIKIYPAILVKNRKTADIVGIVTLDDVMDIEL